jgi:hypothetical protein
MGGAVRDAPSDGCIPSCYFAVRQDFSSRVVRMSIPQLFQPFFQPLVQLHVKGFYPPFKLMQFPCPH